MQEGRRTFKSRFQTALDSKQISRAELSRRTGLSEPLLHYYITGKFEPKAANVKLIADALGVDYNWLMGEEGSNFFDKDNIFSRLSAENFEKVVDYAKYLLSTQEAT